MIIFDFKITILIKIILKLIKKKKNYKEFTSSKNKLYIAKKIMAMNLMTFIFLFQI